MLQTVNNKTMLTSTSYDFSKNLVRLYLPACSTLYATLGSLWGLPYVTQIVGSISALALFFGIVLHVSQKNYDVSGAAYDGQMNVVVDPNTKALVYDMVLNDDVSTLQNQESVSFKVIPQGTNAPTDYPLPPEPPEPPLPPSN